MDVDVGARAADGGSSSAQPEVASAVRKTSPIVARGWRPGGLEKRAGLFIVDIVATQWAMSTTQFSLPHVQVWLRVICSISAAARVKKRVCCRATIAKGHAMKLARLALLISIAAALMLLAAGPGTRLGLWEYGVGLTLMRYALFVGVAGAAFGVVLMLIPATRRGNAGPLAVAIVTGLAVAWVPWNGYRTVRALPFIHDITTDTANPPAFVDVVPLRADATNPVDYPGEETAMLQREGYPDLEPLQLSQSAGQVFERALEVAREMGWEIVAAVPSEGRIEATATTLWFGFKDDVVIRIVPDGDGSRLDIRSKSRVGRSDVGANAARIRKFIAALGRRD